MEEAGALDADETVVVQVKGYHRTRNGKREWVESYEQTRKAGEAENDNAALVLVRDQAPAPQALPPVAGSVTPPQVATLFIGGFGDGKSRIVQGYTSNSFDTGFR